MSLKTLTELRSKFIATWDAVLAAEGLGRISPLTPNGTPDVTWEIDSLMDYQRLVSFTRSTQFDLENRERFLVDYVSPYFKSPSGGYATLEKAIIPRRSFARKVIDNTAMLYKSNPMRWLANDAGPMETEDAAYQSVVREMELPRRMKDIYTLGVVTNFVAVRPLVTRRNGRAVASLHVLTPNQFRVVLSDAGEIVKLMYTTSVMRDGYTGDAVVVWTAEEHYMLDIHAARMTMPDNPDNRNPYGMIPFAFLQLDQYDDEIYAGGAHDLVEACLRRNFLELLQNDDVVFAAIGVWLATNLDLPEGFALSPRMVLTQDKVTQGEGSEVAPKLENISGTPQSALISDLMEMVYKTVATEHGISPAMLDTQVRELSGRALRAMQSELLDRRQSHAEIMEAFERRLYEITAVVLNYERRTGGYQMDADLPTDPAVFQIDFTEPTESDLDEDKRLDIEERLVDKGLLSVTDWYRRYNSDLDDEEEIMGRIKKNLSDARMLRKGGTGQSLLKLLGESEPAQPADLNAAPNGNPSVNMPADNMQPAANPNDFNGAQ